MKKYLPAEIEPRWQKRWEEDRLYQTKDTSNKPKYYCLDMFPYPSGEGLHVGHFKGYCATDIISRYMRMKGYNLLHPIGWDAFGLPAENYAIKSGIHPKITTAKNISRIKEQMIRAGFSYDWSREINTTDPNYYRWTQWIFLEMFKNGLAYEATVPINFCPKDKTGLANEEVIGGLCERCGTKVVKKDIRQWLLKITNYADRLLSDLEGLDWPESIIQMQKNWIGRSEGTTVKFKIKSEKLKIDEIEVFTTRADTLFGATYVVVAPEHELVTSLLKSKVKNQKSKIAEVRKYVDSAKNKTDLERIAEGKLKTGVFSGLYVINPVNNNKLPVWIADYVLLSYGTGAIMAVPAHDQRDFEFAKKYKLPILEVIGPLGKWVSANKKPNNLQSAFTDYGVLINSQQYSGLESKEAIEKITSDLVKKGLARKTVNYKLRDWVFSRQRYWGEPIPLVYCEACKQEVKSQKSKVKSQKYSKGELLNPGWIALSEKDLPAKLPELERYKPTGTGQSPLASIKSWVNTTCPKCGGPAKRETNTMPQWAGSCWYYLAFTMRGSQKSKLKSQKLEWDKKKIKNWLPVDFYVGGAEHAVLHLLYARFWHKFLYDIGKVSTKEPFLKLRSVGVVLGPDGQKMSKSRGNVITPDDIVSTYGADTLRLYEGFMGPFSQMIAWDPKSIEGVYRFLQKVWMIVDQVKSESQKLKVNKLEIAINKLIKKVASDIMDMKFNTAISAMMEFANLALKNKGLLNKSIVANFLLGLAPFAPHITEELWQEIGQKDSIHTNPWPKIDDNLIKDQKVLIIVQVDGKLREKIEIEKEQSKDELQNIVLNLDKVKKWTKNIKIKDTIFVKDRLINFVTK